MIYTFKFNVVLRRVAFSWYTPRGYGVLKGGGGGIQGKFFWSSRLELWAPQVPLIVRETFGEILGPRRPTVSEPRPAQKLGVKYSFPPDYPRGANGAPNCSSHHLDSSHIGFDGSKTNSLAVAGSGPKRDRRNRARVPKLTITWP